ncbi:hypothetical protein EKG38_12860 [Shewanella canadensis]|uniref:Transporter substrate-binding domain-containing protein n=1 Tax=Shewanella canadensis TaxID=271096 RepID=A0A3S0INN7_9GAMM|nr:hypothetical protein [Shewanella canadensis]RTR38407.1 hypothetical protein EKG38_12860 [Shewanella canadensis]
MLRAACALLCFSCLMIQAGELKVTELKAAGSEVQGLEIAELEVIAMDYAPFTSETSDDNGLAFKLLSDALSQSATLVKPQFLSAARAHRMVQEGKWCASFYPPQSPVDDHRLIGLADEPIKLGLYRRREATPFVWNSLTELAGKRVAYFRALERDGLGFEMIQAGMDIFSVETTRQGLQLLAKGRVDYAFGDQTSGPALMKQLGLNPDDYQFSETVFRALPVGIWLNLSCPQALTAFHYLDSHGYLQIDIDNL